MQDTLPLPETTTASASTAPPNATLRAIAAASPLLVSFVMLSPALFFEAPGALYSTPMGIVPIPLTFFAVLALCYLVGKAATGRPTPIWPILLTACLPAILGLYGVAYGYQLTVDFQTPLTTPPTRMFVLSSRAVGGWLGGTLCAATGMALALAAAAQPGPGRRANAVLMPIVMVPLVGLAMSAATDYYLSIGRIDPQSVPIALFACVIVATAAGAAGPARSLPLSFGAAASALLAVVFSMNEDLANAEARVRGLYSMADPEAIELGFERSLAHLEPLVVGATYAPFLALLALLGFGLWIRKRAMTQRSSQRGLVPVALMATVFLFSSFFALTPNATERSAPSSQPTVSRR